MFPIVRRTPEYTAWLVPPVYVARGRPIHGVFPLYLRTEHDLWAVPSWHSRWSSDGSRSDRLWPLFSLRREPDHDELRVLWRLFGWETRKDDRSFILAYLVQREWGPDHWWNLVFPLYSQYAENDERGFYLFPYHQKRGPLVHSTGVFPLFDYSRGADDSHLWILPYYQSRSPRHSTHILFPFYLGRTERISTDDESRVVALAAVAALQACRAARRGREPARTLPAVPVLQRQARAGRLASVLGVGDGDPRANPRTRQLAREAHREARRRCARSRPAPDPLAIALRIPNLHVLAFADHPGMVAPR